MFTDQERREIIALMNREIVPAIGCTEPIAVALCVAKATETLGREPEHIEARLSANVLKNAMGVGIPWHWHDGSTHCHGSWRARGQVRI